MRHGLPLTVALLVLLIAGAAACGDDDDTDDSDETTIEEYFQRVEDIKREFDAQTEALDRDLSELDDDEPDQQLEGLREYYENSEAAFETAVDDLQELDPPSEAEDAHNEFTDAGRSVLDESESLFEELQEVDNIDEADDVFEDTPEIDDASSQFEEACRELQSLADRSGVEVDLGCGDD